MMIDQQVRIGESMEILKTLPNRSVPLIVTDPPYGIGYHSNYYKERNPHRPIANDWDFDIGEFLKECARILTEGGAMYLFCRWDVYPGWYPFVKEVGLKVKSLLVWKKDNWTAGDLTGEYANQHEFIMFVVKGRHLLRGKRWPNVWEFPRVPAKKLLCPAQKPVPLLERAIQSSSDPGDLVLDPFCGSGSTGVAASQLNRRYLLSDIDPGMVAITKRRLGLSDPAEEPAVPPPLPAFVFEPPDSLLWGVHPEELRFVVEAIKENLDRLSLIGEYERTF